MTRRLLGAAMAAESAGRAAQECGVKNLEVRIKGPGPGRESAVRALNALGMNLEVVGDTAQALADLIDTERSLRLELIIVLLIVFEIFITFYQMFTGAAGH